MKGDNEERRGKKEDDQESLGKEKGDRRKTRRCRVYSAETHSKLKGTDREELESKKGKEGELFFIL